MSDCCVDAVTRRFVCFLASYHYKYIITLVNVYHRYFVARPVDRSGCGADGSKCFEPRGPSSRIFGESFAPPAAVVIGIIMQITSMPLILQHITTNTL